MKVKIAMEFQTPASVTDTMTALRPFFEGLNALAGKDTSGNRATVQMIEEAPQVLFNGKFKSGIGFINEPDTQG